VNVGGGKPFTRRAWANVLAALLGCAPAPTSSVARAPGSLAPTVLSPVPRERRPLQPLSKRIGGADPRAAPVPPEPLSTRDAGQSLGTFRNTYYDFPREQDYTGPFVPLFDARCRRLATVPVGFHDSLCVQGSGQLKSGRTVSFARRACSCARRCPRTAQHICFEALDPMVYPFGRGAAGRAITPLSSVAVDSTLIPLGTSLYIPEYVGLPLSNGDSSGHDGCFVAQDRGIGIVGAHVDIFTGEEAMTRRWNSLVPSNRGVTLFTDSPLCIATH
jgi:3D (Asp-Asp-Asp) domain-containing protein